MKTIPRGLDPTISRKALQGALERLEKRIDPQGEIIRVHSADENLIKEAYKHKLIDYEDALHLLEKSRNYKETKQKKFIEDLNKKKNKFKIEDNRLKRKSKRGHEGVSISSFILACFILYFLLS